MARIFWALALALAAALSAPSVAAGLKLGPGYAEGCTPPTLKSWPVGPPRVPRLSPKEKPNFIVILVDDMGWDDIGLHHPRGPDGVSSAGAQTPNVDKLIKSGMSFTNFYSASLCAMGRAQLLTGRDYARTGNLFNGMGFDAFHLGEATMGNVMQQAGYTTAHYGKWHNSRTLGYEPWWRGFNESWLPSHTYLQVDNLMRYNGEYVQTKGLVEQIMADKIIGFLKEREQDQQPFLQYYAPYAIHATPWNKNQPGFDWNQVLHNKTAQASIYFQPEPYKSIILNQQPPPGEVNARVWAFLMYLDDVLGKIFDYVGSSPLLRKNTYIMLTSDNGPGLPWVFDKKERLQRLPSGMQGDKNTFKGDGETAGAGMEGSLRNHLAVWGPGVPSGGVSDTLLSLADVLPTIAELADAMSTKHEPWSGRSFANLLQPNSSPTPEQERRFQFTLVISAKPEQCPAVERLMTRLLPTLGPNREVLKPQPLIAYTDNGKSVMKHCIVGRHGKYKWFGMNNKVYRLVNGSHIELPCNEVVDESQHREVAARFNAAAEAWWNSVVAEPHSFTKLVYVLGLPGFARPANEPTNVEASGIIQLRRGGSMVLNSIVNYTSVGDFGCWKIRPVTAGTYHILLMYHGEGFAGLSMSFRMDIWQHGTARHSALTTTKKFLFKIDTKASKRTFTAAMVSLPASDGTTDTEFRLRIVDVAPDGNDTASSNATAGVDTVSRGDRRAAPWAPSGRETWASQKNATQSGWVFRLANIRFVPVETSPGVPTVPGSGRRSRPGREERPAAATSAEIFAPTATYQGVPFGMPEDAFGVSGSTAEPATYTHFKPSPAMLKLERLVRLEAISEAQEMNNAAGTADLDAVAASSSPQGKWRQLQQKYNWMDGQMVFRSLFRTCVNDAAPGCMETCGG